MRIAVAVLCICALVPALSARADEACSDPAAKAEATRLTQLAREADIKGTIDGMMGWPMMAPIPEEPRKRIGTRFAEEFRLLWNEPHHFASILEVFCKSLTPGNMDESFRKFKQLMAGRKLETDELRAKWIVESLRKVQPEFPELNRPDALLALGDVYARQGRPAYATDNFKRLLKLQPDDPAATEWLGAILYVEQGLLKPDAMQEALAYFRKLVQIEPAAPEGHHWIGVIDWGLSFNALVTMRYEYNKTAATHLLDADPLPPAMRQRFTSQYGGMIDDGIAHLQQALKLAPDFEEAAMYLNLLYRLKGAEAEAPAERQRYTNMAEELLARALLTPSHPARFLRPDVPAPPPPPPDTSSEQQSSTPIGIDRKEMEARIVKRVEAKYPPLARQAKIEGTVRLKVVIDTDGAVESVAVLDGHPLLLQAAIDAVKQWRYKPWLVDGQPVKVDSTLDVIFSLH